jgi:GDPmannose 4,6-dehydratase
MWMMNQQKIARDYIIATGRSVSLRYFTERVFAECGLSADGYLVEDNSLFRPLEIMQSRADPSRAQSMLGWKHHYDVDDVVREMVAYQMARIKAINNISI